MKIDVVFTPSDVKTGSEGGFYVVVDVLRASSSMVTALGNGSLGIYPVMETAEALSLADGMEVLACGERNGVRLSGFHLGNSPREFTRQAVAGRELAMSTTNGTTAIRAAMAFGRTFVGCFLNAPVISSFLAESGQDITILCAGREGAFSIEDTLCAGMIVSRLGEDMTDTARASSATFEALQQDIERMLVESQHGRFLRQIGFGEDITFCARVGSADVIAEVFSTGESPPRDLIIKQVLDPQRLKRGKI